MTVYVEYAFLDNFTMDFLLLFCAALTLKIRFRWWRLVLGACVGTAIALATVYVCGFWQYVAKALCLFLMCATSVGFGKKLFWHILLTLAYTFVTGGAIVGLFNLFRVEYVSQNGFCYNMPVPLFVYFLAVTLCALLCYFLCAFVSQNKKIAPFLRKVKLSLDKTYTLLGFCDSGNTVSYNGLPVCFVTKKIGGVSAYFAQKILKGETVQAEVCTLTGTKKVTAVFATVTVGKTERKILLALPFSACKTQYDLILNGEFCEIR